MGDSFDGPGSRNYSEVRSVVDCKKRSPKSFSYKSLRQIASITHGKMGRTGQVASFLLKVAVLEIVRQFSRARCPFVWSSLQGLQVLCYPPFKWIQRWNPFRVLVEGMQRLSRPILVLSVATAFFDQSECSSVTSDGVEGSRGHNDSRAISESHSESAPVLSTPDTRYCDDAPSSLSSTNWLRQLYAELESQGISLPEWWFK